MNQKKKGGRKAFKAVKKPVIKKQFYRPAPIVPRVMISDYANKIKMVDPNQMAEEEQQRILGMELKKSNPPLIRPDHGERMDDPMF